MVRVKKSIPMDRIRKRIAEKMSTSSREIPHVTLVMEADITKMSRIREEVKKERHDISYTGIIVLATALSLKRYPLLNGRLEDDDIIVYEDININIAVDTEYGLITPVVKNADEKSLTDISREIRELVDKARNRRLTISDVTGGTFTITNLGMYDVSFFTPIINYPQVGTLGIGKIYNRASCDSEVKKRRLMDLCLSFDHRVIDGGPAARFLKDVKRSLEKTSWIYERLV